MTLLSDQEITARLRVLKGWKREKDFLTKEFKYRRFMDGIRFITSVARVAEKLEHHPDIYVRWTSVKLLVQTHDEGGLTERDFELASSIEKAVLSSSRRRQISA